MAYGPKPQGTNPEGTKESSLIFPKCSRAPLESVGGPLPPPVVEPSEELGLEEKIQGLGV